MGLGERIWDLLKGADTPTVVGVEESDTVQSRLEGNEYAPEDEIKGVMVNYWNTIEDAFQGDSEKFREVRIYDGSLKRSDPGQSHVDNFIPEFNFHNEPTPPFQDFRPYERNKRDNSFVPEYLEVSETPVLDEVRNGYRVIIKDEEVEPTSIIRYSVEALDRTEENDIPVSYEHKSPGSTYIISKTSGEFQLFFEQKGAYFIRYGVWNGKRNEDSKPTVVVLG